MLVIASLKSKFNVRSGHFEVEVNEVNILGVIFKHLLVYNGTAKYTSAFGNC